MLNAAFEVRKEYFGNEVKIHIINNVQNGYCSEDCRYCVQSRDADSEINEYPMKSDEEIVAKAKNAYENGAYRHCMVFSGKQLSKKRAKHLSILIREIKSKYPIQVCVSHGQLDKEKALILKEAGLDRLNHNLNTSRRYYPQICTTHIYEDRIATLKNAREAGLQICSGVIVGMGETADDIFETACTLRDLKIESIPVNFFIPIKGVKLDIKPNLSPAYCLRVLCLYRFLNPEAEIRVAAGWEIYFRSMQVLAFYPANSMFMGGYLNTRGKSRIFILQMIKDAGFKICSDYSLDELIQREL